MATNDDLFADGQGQTEITYKPSSHQFTDPIRLFKANDPYYWEVDNIPLNQLQENLLWLKDQVGAAEEANKLTRADFDELRPTATGEDRVVRVSPGRFMGRVNDAFNTGISTLALKALGTIEGKGISDLEITTPDSTLQALAGVSVSNILADNGLYDYTQHNVTSPGGGTNVTWSPTHTSFIQNKKSGVADLQKIKLALWKQGTTVKTYGGNPSSEVDLQQLSVEFTRVYGAPFRTSLVNSPTELTIDVPSFEDDDYQNTTTYVPSVRIDLLFMYTKPVDAESTTILRQDGESLSKILTPQLGIVKGAGVISLNPKPDGGTWGSQTIDTDFFLSDVYAGNKDNPSVFFEPSGNADAQGNKQTASVLSDLNQNTMGVANTFGNFPSPDDLMNAAPYITDGVAKNNAQLVGQSVLPLAYIFTKKEKPLVESVDILDIRPFFRTAELTYNERAGLAAANPPTSLANPVVSKYQLADTATKLKNYVLGQIPEIPTYPRPVGSGYVFGGIKYGPEGVIVRAAADNSVQDFKFTGNISSQTSITEYLKQSGYMPNITGQIPSNPDWDTPGWATAQSSNPGNKRNDKFFYWYQSAPDAKMGGKAATYGYSQDANFNNQWGNHVDTVGFSTTAGAMTWYVKKRIDLDKSQVPWMSDYHVRLTLANCALAVDNAQYFNFSKNLDQATVMQAQGLYLEKYPDHFNIICTWAIRPPFSGSNDYGPGGDKKWSGVPPEYRDDRRFAGVFVTSEATRLTQAPGSNTQTGGFNGGDVFPAYMSRNGVCTYPTVHFEIIGYPQSYTQNIKINSGSDSTIKLVPST